MNKIQKSNKIYIGIIISIGIIITSLSFYFINANGREKLLNLQNKETDNQLDNLKIILKLIYPILNVGVIFMEKFTPFNSSLADFIKFSGINDSSIITYVSDLKPIYNISNNDRLLFEQQLSIITGKNSTIIDILPNGTLVPASKREWYCPVIYTSPLNNLTFWIPGLDSCNIPSLQPLLQELNNTNYIVSSTRTQLVTNLNLIDFAIKTPNGFLLITFNPNTLFKSLKNKNIDTILYYNNKEFYKTCNNCKTDSTFFRKLKYENDEISFNLIFNDTYIDINIFYLIFVAVLFIVILSIIFLIRINIGVNKYTDANEMLGYVNHEIRNPLNCIKGMIEISLIDIHEKNDISSVVYNLNIAKNVVHLLSHIVNDVLDYQKLIDGKLLIIQTDIIIEDFEKILFNIISPKLWEKPLLEYKFINNDNIRVINSDESRLIQILLNFLTNSIKFTEQGSVTVIIEKIQKSIKFSVKDTGRGISEDDISKIFQPYKQTGIIDSLRHGGIGLGLYLCKTLVQLMKGDIGFESKIGIGSTFWITIPYKELNII